MSAVPAQSQSFIETDCDTPFTRTLLRTLVATFRAKPNETEAEYKERYAAVVIAFAAFAPRDAIEQMLAAQIVAASQAALDCMTQAIVAEDSLSQAALHRSYTAFNRTVNATMRTLAKAQARPAAAIAPPPVIEAPAQPARVVALKPPQHPIRREPARATPAPKPPRDPAKMDDDELIARMEYLRARMEAEGNLPNTPLTP